MTFGQSQLLHLLWLIPVLALVAYAGYTIKKRQLTRFVSPELWPSIVPSLSTSRRFWKRASLIAAVAFLIICLARPQWGVKFEKVERKGLDIFIAVDTSLSMAAEDVVPSRFSRAKQEIQALMEELKGDRVGLIAFAGDAFVQSPLTLDYDAAALFLNQVTVGMLPNPGSNLSKAMDMALASFLKKNKRKKILVIFSDGETFNKASLKVAKKAKKQGVIVYAVGVGTGEGEPIPIIDDSGQITGYKKNKQGAVVLSKLNDALLKQIAVETDGLYFNTEQSGLIVNDLYRAISNIEKEAIESDMLKTYEDQYQWVLVLVIGLLMFDLLFFERKRTAEWKGRL